MKRFTYSRIGAAALAVGTCVGGMLLQRGSLLADVGYSGRSGASGTTSSTSETGKANTGSDINQNNLSSSEQKFLRKAADANIMEINMARLALDRSQSTAVRDFAQRIIDDHTRANSQLVALGAQKGISLPTVASASSLPSNTTGGTRSLDENRTTGPQSSLGTDPNLRNDTTSSGNMGTGVDRSGSVADNTTSRSTTGGTSANGTTTERSESTTTTTTTHSGVLHNEAYDKLASLSGPEFDRVFLKHMVQDHRTDIQEFDNMSKNAKNGDVRSFSANLLPTLKEHLRTAQDLQQTVDRRM